MTLNIYSNEENVSVAADTTDLPHELRQAPTPAQSRAAPGSDGIKSFMAKFVASATLAEAVAPATQDFVKASSFLFRK